MIPSKMPFRQPHFKRKEHPSQRLTPERSTHTFQPQLHRSWGKRRRRSWTNLESSLPPGPILKMCASAQAAQHLRSGPALADQIQQSDIMRKGEADDLGVLVKNLQFRRVSKNRNKFWRQLLELSRQRNHFVGLLMAKRREDGISR